jgi:hypothetical protein
MQSLPMRPFEPLDDDTAIEEYPGYLGHIWDYDFFPGPELQILSGFLWVEYQELLEDLSREIEVSVDDTKVAVKLHCFGAGLAAALDQLPPFDVTHDDGSSYNHPCGGSGYVIFLADGHELSSTVTWAAALRVALDKDLFENRL